MEEANESCDKSCKELLMNDLLSVLAEAEEAEANKATDEAQESK